MYRQCPPAIPRVLHNRGPADVDNLLNNIEFAETVDPSLCVADRCEQRAVFKANVLYVAQPIVRKANAAALKRGSDAAASIVPTDDYVFYAKHLYSKLNDREAI